MKDSKIRWTDNTWNTVIGCSKVSEGCRLCYAETIALKFNMTPKTWTAKNAAENVILKPHKLGEPKKWKEPFQVFVNSMSDFFHDEIPDDYLDQMMKAMIDADWHTYQILTKRPERMRDYLSSPDLAGRLGGDSLLSVALPLPQCWWGVSIESRKHLDRLKTLQETPAAVRFISFEPLLEPVGAIDLSGIHWVIVGGESGAGFREMDHAWAREIRDQCVEQGVEFYFKQSSARHTEQGKSLVEEDGSRTVWEYYPIDGKRQEKEALPYRFDGFYDLSDGERFEIDAKTEKIRMLVADMRIHILEIGKQLSEVQALLAKRGSGTFQSWLKEGFGWSQRTAYNFISVYEKFGECANFAQMNIEPSALYKLAAPSTPDAARVEAMELADRGETVSHKTAESIIDRHKPESSPSSTFSLSIKTDDEAKFKALQRAIDEIRSENNCTAFEALYQALVGK